MQGSRGRGEDREYKVQTEGCDDRKIKKDGADGATFSDRGDSSGISSDGWMETEGGTGERQRIKYL